MAILGLSPIEWALVAAITALIVGIGRLPELRGRRHGGKGKGR